MKMDLPDTATPTDSAREETGGNGLYMADVGHGQLLSETAPEHADTVVEGQSSARPPADAITCYIDRITNDGYIEGWARDETKSRPCLLQILQNGNIIAYAVADTYRKDLLRAGIGHGHYAFYARLFNVRSGDSELAVIDMRSGGQVRVAGVTKHQIPIILAPRVTRVEDLLRRRCWTIEDLLEQVPCLQLDENMRIMGAHRFVDVTFMFLLNHWVDEAGLIYVRQLESREVSPDNFFRELASPKKLEGSKSLPGPYDGHFPYTIV